MSEAQRQRAEALFHHVVELPPDDRMSYLDQHCDDDGIVRAEVESLLAYYDDGTVTSLGVEALTDRDETELVGHCIGPYKLTQLLGEGGFGAVYLAEQEEPVKREVALKIIKLGMDTRQVIARFEAERQALAMMEHPSIARVLDAGATDSGRPYFVMELVRGVPITEYCDERRLPVRERLLLINQVCRAVQHAHQKGIIHRDIKPSNVLVTLHDGRPVPKIIDFGIAKATKQRLTDGTQLTELRQFIGTPQYMSPEQAEMSELDIDTRSDIYSLGVLLYELLTGTTPFESSRFRSVSHPEIQRIIREEDPPVPSLRAVEPDALRRAIRGDLDWIVMKAIDKDRTRRYETAASLASDVERHLNHEPVVAGPPRATYKFRKFLRRHRVGALAGSLVALALIAGFALAMVGFVRARNERDLADAEKARAQAMSRFFQEMLASADPLQMRQLAAFALDDNVVTLPAAHLERDVSVAQMVRRAGARIDTTFEGQPILAATAHETVGMTLRGLGLFAEAEPHLRAALDARHEALGHYHPDTLRSALALGVVLRDQGRPADALPLVERAFDGMIREYGVDDPRSLSCSTIMGTVWADQNAYLEADIRYFRALEGQKKVLGPEHRDTLVTMWHWAVAHLAQGKLNEAEPLARDVYEIAALTLPPDDSLNILSKPLMGWWYLAQHRYADAESVMRPGVEQCRRILGSSHPFTYLTMQGLARSLQGREHQDEKERLQEAALEGLLATRGPFHRHTIATMTDFARWLDARGSHAAAEKFYRRLVDTARASFGERAAPTLAAMQKLAQFLERKGALDEAADVLRTRYEIQLAASGPRGFVSMSARDEFARALVRMGKINAARDITRELLELTAEQVKNLPNNALAANNLAWYLVVCVPADMRDPNRALPLAERAVELSGNRSSPVLDTLAMTYYRLERFQEAADVQRRSLELLQPAFARDLNYGANLVRYLLATGDRQAADLYVEESIERYRDALGDDRPLLAQELRQAGVTLAGAGHYELAEALLTEALERLRALHGEQHDQVARTLHELATLYTQWDKYSQAVAPYQRAIDIQRELLGDEHLVVAELSSALGNALRTARQLEQAETVLSGALDTYRRLNIDSIPAALRLKRNLADTLIGLDRLDEAAPLIRDALAGSYAIYTDEHEDTALAMQVMGELLVAQGELAEAEPMLRECVASLTRLSWDAHEQWRVAAANGALGHCLLRLGRFADAESLLLDCRAMLHDCKGEEFRGTCLAGQRLVELYDAWGKLEEAAHWRERVAEGYESPDQSILIAPSGA